MRPHPIVYIGALGSGTTSCTLGKEIACYRQHVDHLWAVPLWLDQAHHSVSKVQPHLPCVFFPRLGLSYRFLTLFILTDQIVSIVRDALARREFPSFHLSSCMGSPSDVWLMLAG